MTGVQTCALPIWFGEMESKVSMTGLMGLMEMELHLDPSNLILLRVNDTYCKTTKTVWLDPIQASELAGYLGVLSNIALLAKREGK